MKVFYTPAIDGFYRFELQVRLADKPDNEAYKLVQDQCGLDAIDRLDSIGSVKMLDVDPTGVTKGYWTYQQDSL